jgi:hypothetical protein
MNLVMLDDSVVVNASKKSYYYSFEGSKAFKNTDTGNVFFIARFEAESSEQVFTHFKIKTRNVGDATFGSGDYHSPYLIVVDGKIHEADEDGSANLFYCEADYRVNTSELTKLDAPACNKIPNQVIIEEMHEIMNIIISDYFNIPCNVSLNWDWK